MGALAAPLLGYSGTCLFHFHVRVLLSSGMVCCISLVRDRTILSLSHCCQSTPAPADQVVILRWKCGRYLRSRINSATVYLPFAWASWLVLSAYRWACLYCNLVHLPALLRPCHSALPVFGH